MIHVAREHIFLVKQTFGNTTSDETIHLCICDIANSWNVHHTASYEHYEELSCKAYMSSSEEEYRRILCGRQARSVRTSAISCVCQATQPMDNTRITGFFVIFVEMDREGE